MIRVLVVCICTWSSCVSVNSPTQYQYSGVSAAGGKELYLYPPKEPDQHPEPDLPFRLVLSQFPWLAWEQVGGSKSGRSRRITTVDGKPHALGIAADSNEGGTWTLFDGNLSTLATQQQNLPVCSSAECWAKHLQREDFDPYDILQVSRSDEPDVIRAAFRRLSRQSHPDSPHRSSAGSGSTAREALIDGGSLFFQP
jgi:hypothetical protein